jgi:hypothetical protein
MPSISIEGMLATAVRQREKSSSVGSPTLRLVVVAN